MLCSQVLRKALAPRIWWCRLLVSEHSLVREMQGPSESKPKILLQIELGYKLKNPNVVLKNNRYQGKCKSDHVGAL